VIRRVVMAVACTAVAAGLAGLDPAAAGVFTAVVLGVLIVAACASTARLVPATIALASNRSDLGSGVVQPAHADRSGVLSVMRR
jgi:hypothetical protein